MKTRRNDAEGVRLAEDDRKRWDARYAEGAYADRTYPSAYLAENVTRFQAGRAADVACGRGRNALFLAGRGFAVDAYDISPVGLELARRRAALEQLEVEWVCRDLLEQPVLDDVYDLIVMVRFVAPELLAALPRYLKPGGHVLIEAHLSLEGAPAGPYAGPSGERFRVRRGELVRGLGGLEPVDAFEGEVVEPDGARAYVARLIARSSPHASVQ